MAAAGAQTQDADSPREDAGRRKHMPRDNMEVLHRLHHPLPTEQDQEEHRRDSDPGQGDPDRRKHGPVKCPNYTILLKNGQTCERSGSSEPGQREPPGQQGDHNAHRQYTKVPKKGKTHHNGDEPHETLDELSSYVQLTDLVVLATARTTWPTDDDDPFQEGWEPVWYATILADGHELQRSGIDTLTFADAIDRAIASRNDNRYADEARGWAAGLRKRWLRRPQYGRPHRWGPHPPEYAEEFATDVENMMRARWLRELCPEAVMNRACEGSRIAAGFADPSCSSEALEREWHEARNRHLSRSRTPQRRHALAAGPRPPDNQGGGPSRRRMLEEDLSCWDSEVRMHLLHYGTQASQEANVEDETGTNSPRRLLGRRVSTTTTTEEADEPDLSALVVRKWLLKKKGKGGYMRRLVDNPAAWKQGPGVKDMGDAHFIWRAMLQLESDEECEDAEPQRMPGFINDPVWSSVWETLMNQSEPAFRLMRRALPGFLELVGQDLQSIVDQVAHQRGIADDAEEDEGEQASASTARPGREAEETDEVQVQVEEEQADGEPDLSTLMQSKSKVAGGRSSPAGRAPDSDPGQPGEGGRELIPGEVPETVTEPKNDEQSSSIRSLTRECNSKLCVLRDELEEQWYQGMEVNCAINKLRAECTAGLRDVELQECTHILQQLLAVIPPEHQRPQPTGRPESDWPLSPSQQQWVMTTAQQVRQLTTLSAQPDDGEEVAMMQRTLTGTLFAETPHLAKSLNQAIQQRAADVPEWDSVHAVLVAHAGKPKAALCGAPIYGREEWLRRWTARLLIRGGIANEPLEPERASSSHEIPVPAREETPEEQQERLARQQNEEDAQLYRWHQREVAREEQQRAREAQLRDRATLQAHLGWSSAPPGKKIRVTVEMRSTTASKYSEWEVGEGDEIKIKLGISMVEHGGNHIHEGRKVDREIGTRELLRREQQLVEQMQHDQTRPGDEDKPEDKRQSWSTNDPNLQPHYQAWREGRTDFKGLVERVGEDAAVYLVEAAEVAQLELDTVPDMDVSARDEWLRGEDVDNILTRPACIADYYRWAEGDLMESDVVDKWGGQVKRAFHAWFIAGGPPQHPEDGGEAAPLAERTEMEEEAHNQALDAPDLPEGEGGIPDTMDEMETVPWEPPAWDIYVPYSNVPPGDRRAEEEGSDEHRRRDGIRKWGSPSSGS
ncbi:unnamed protein product [Symbiodinium sp. CCMP2592]|nr:unnamed protein product [Symbiodinium sp. CCMP2592]